MIITVLHGRHRWPVIGSLRQDQKPVSQQPFWPAVRAMSMSCVEMKGGDSTDVYTAELMMMIAPAIESGVGVVWKKTNSSKMAKTT